MPTGPAASSRTAKNLQEHSTLGITNKYARNCPLPLNGDDPEVHHTGGLCDSPGKQQLRSASACVQNRSQRVIRGPNSDRGEIERIFQQYWMENEATTSGDNSHSVIWFELSKLSPDSIYTEARAEARFCSL